MTQHQLEWAAIALMGLVTFGTRAAGVWLAPLVPQRGLGRKVVDHLPSTLLVAIATPYFSGTDPILIAAACATLLVAAAATRLVVSMLVGVVTVAVLRAVI